MAKINNVTRAKIADLTPYEKNARVHTDGQIDQIAASIKEFGFLNPILIDKDGNIIAGHGRVMAAERLGMEDVPALYVEGLTDAQRRAYILADNRLTELGGWNMDLVNIELEELALEGFNVELTGFEIPETAPEIIEDETPAAPAEPRVKLGDVWTLGRHRLICGDSTDPATFEKLLNGGRADICITSPPYNASHMDIKFSADRGGGVQSSTQRKYINDDDTKTDDEYFDFISANIDALLMYCDEVFYNVGVGSGSKRAIGRILYNYADQFKDLIYWEKENPMPVITRGVISSAVELIICLGNNGTRAFNCFDNRMFHGVINGPSASASNQYADIHKATFPVYLPAEIIKNFTNADGVVVDCFGGTGTSLIACEQLGRSCRMIELEPLYCDVIISRWEALTGQTAILEA